MHARIMSVHLCSMLGSVVKHHRIFVVFVSAQESAKLWLAYPVSAMAHDEQSLAAVAANSAVASRARVHELLGRNDVRVSCVCPMCFCLGMRLCVCVCMCVCLCVNVCVYERDG